MFNKPVGWFIDATLTLREMEGGGEKNFTNSKVNILAMSQGMSQRSRGRGTKNGIENEIILL